MFCLTSLKKWEDGNPSLNLKCNPIQAIELRAQFEAIQPGYHMSKVHWNTVFLNQDVVDKKVCHLINHSYELVFSSLQKKMKQEIEKLEN